MYKKLKEIYGVEIDLIFPYPEKQDHISVEEYKELLDEYQQLFWGK